MDHAREIKKVFGLKYKELMETDESDSLSFFALLIALRQNDIENGQWDKSLEEKFYNILRLDNSFKDFFLKNAKANCCTHLKFGVSI